MLEGRAQLTEGFRGGCGPQPGAVGGGYMYLPPTAAVGDMLKFPDDDDNAAGGGGPMPIPIVGTVPFLVVAVL